ncbi:MAG TPA: hypothetical protein VJK27_13010 [Terriglobales bacterium]|jgi:hypothetical protein|nr:hypothetical protein [Terriglobales bacterium]
MATKVRAILAEYHNATYNVRLPSVLGGEIYFPISAIIRGPDLNQLAEISKKVADRMHQYPLDLAAAHTISSIKEVGMPVGYSYLFSWSGKGSGRNNLEPVVGNVARFGFHVHGIGGTV